MASIFSVFLMAFLLTPTIQFVANGRPLDHNPSSSLMARLKLDEESADCWQSLTQLQACSGDLIMFFLNGETKISASCCGAIWTISHQCWSSMFASLGFTSEEIHVLEGYCDREDESSPSVGTKHHDVDVVSSKINN